MRDEGLVGTARITMNVLRDAKARARVLEMRSVFRNHAHRMCAVMLVAQKPRPARCRPESDRGSGASVLH